MGPIHVIECFVPEMIRAGRGGQLVNIASAAALIGLPWHAPYSASKYGLRGVSEVLRFDLRRHKIGVSLVCPGGVNTPIVDAVDIAGVNREKFRSSGVTGRFVRHAKSPEHVAEKILDGITRNRYLVHTSGDIRLIHLIERRINPLYAALMRGANRLAVRQFRQLR
jgi:short-subunit dehydrogenase